MVHASNSPAVQVESDSGKPRTKDKRNFLVIFLFHSAQQLKSMYTSYYKLQVKQVSPSISAEAVTSQFEDKEKMHSIPTVQNQPSQDDEWKPWPWYYWHFHLLRSSSQMLSRPLHIQPRLKLQAVRRETTAHQLRVLHNSFCLAGANYCAIIVWHSAMSSFQVKKQDPLKAQVSYKHASMLYSKQTKKPSFGCRRLFQMGWWGNTLIPTLNIKTMISEWDAKEK